MAEGLNFDGPTEDLDVFDCPKCGQTIDASADVCRFCGAKVDHKAAQQAAHLLARVDLACSDASYLRNTAAVVVLLLIGVAICVARSGRLIVVVGFQNTVLGFCALVLLLASPFPLWALRWWRKYSGLSSQDDDLDDARRGVRAVGTSATTALLASGALMCLILLLRFAHT